MSIIIVAIVFFTASILSIINFYMLKKNYLNELRTTKVQSYMESKKSSIQSTILTGIQSVQILANDPALKAWVDSDEMDDVYGQLVKDQLTEMATKYSYFTSSFVSNRTYNYWIKNNTLLDTVSKNDINDTWFFDIVKSKKRLHIQMDTNIDIGDTFLFINILIGNLNNPSGIASVGIKLNDLTDQLLKSQITDNTQIYLTDKSGLILSSNEPQKINKSLSEFIDKDISKKILDSNSDFTLYETKNNGSIILNASSRIEGTDYYIVNIIDSSEMLEFVNLMRNVMVIIGLIVALISVFLSSQFIRIITNPINYLNKSFEDLSQGEGDLTKSIDVKTKDELGLLSKNFNLFVGKLRDIMNIIKDISIENIGIKESLRSSSEETAAASVEISANVKGVKDRVNKLNEVVIGTDNYIQGIVENINKQNAQVDDQSAAVEESSSAVNQMVASLNNIESITELKKQASDKLSLTSKDGLDKIETTNDIVTDISGSVDTILEMVNIIKGISSQTNLLSMNAAIEAAHAGDAGKGFSVVADEIRKLAETSSHNSTRIEEELRTIVNKIESAATSSLDSKNAFEEINKEVYDVAKAFEEIYQSTAELSTGGSEIINAMRILNDTTILVKEESSLIHQNAEEMKGAMSTVTRLSIEVTGSMEEISTGFNEVSSAMSYVADLSGQLSETITRQDNEINKFKT